MSGFRMFCSSQIDVHLSLSFIESSDPLFRLIIFFIFALYRHVYWIKLYWPFTDKESSALLSICVFEESFSASASWFQGKPYCHGTAARLIAKLQSVESKVLQNALSHSHIPLDAFCVFLFLLSKMDEWMISSCTPYGMPRWKILPEAIEF